MLKSIPTLHVPQRILLIDDDQAMLSLGKELLETEGYQVFTASSGAMAFGILAEVEKPHLILLDVRMENMSGPKFLKRFNSQKSNGSVPVVFYTANENPRLGKAAGYIQKTGNIEKLLEEIRFFLEQGEKTA